MCSEPLRGDHTPAAARALTPSEHAVVGLLASAMTLYAADVAGTGRTREDDLREFGAKIHDLQNAVLAQAAARAYPDLYRLAGYSIADRTPLDERA